MRILAIRGENLASLPHFEVDFDADPLRGAGLFCVSGPTGAGKSTLLDALCLALYDALPRLDGAGADLAIGRLDGSEDALLKLNDVRAILRHGAGEGVAEADFVGRDGRSYRARWSVNRARRRAAGRLQDRKMSLLDIAADEIVAAGKITDVKRAIVHTVGLSFEQFRRAALLAQGDFDAFIRADAKSRADLLERITGATIYARLSAAAHRRAAEERGALRELTANLDAHHPLEASARARLEAEERAAAARRAAAQSAIKTIEAGARWRDDERRLEAAASAASAEAEQVEADRSALLAAAAVAAARAVDQTENERRKQHAWLAENAAATRLADRFDEALADLQAWADATARRQRAVDEARDAATRETEARAALEALERDRDAAAKAVQEGETAVAARRRAAEAVDLPALRREAAGILATERAIDRAAAAAAMGRAAEAAAQLAAAEIADAVRAATDAETGADALRAELPALDAAVAAGERALDRWRAASGAAATRLRASLRPGEPCPVCGGVDHVAAYEDDVRDALQSFEATVETDRSARRDAQDRLAALAARAAGHRRDADAAEQRRETAEATLGQAREDWRAAARALAEPTVAQGSPLAAAVAALADAADREAALAAIGSAAAAARADVDARLADGAAAEQDFRNAVAAVGDAMSRLAAVDAERETARAAASAAAAARADLKTELEIAAAKADDLASGLERLVGAVAQDWRATPLERTTDVLRGVAEAAENCRRRLRAAEEALPSLIELRREVDALTEGLVAHPTAGDAAPPPVEIAPSSIRSAIAGIERRRASTDQAKTTTATALATHRQARPAEPADLSEAALTTARAQAEADLSAAEAARDAAFAALKQDDAAHAARRDAHAAVAARQAAAEVWLQLDELIGSADGSKFRRYAQSLTLRQLVALANRQLAELHPRYALEVAPGRDGEELALQAIDYDMGEERRGVHNLSGGERFLVSLALALGLSALSGESGVRVESLFIDEGFGALDAESLSLAVGALEALQATGRRIGVITHVEEMKERIPIKILVERDGVGGSTVRVVDEALR